MNDSKEIKQEQTLMQAYERLEKKCSHLKDVAVLTEKLNAKLNRKELSDEIDTSKKEAVENKNIVELFNLIADQMETQINVIADCTNRSMSMID